jgi:hypothetical protein
MAPKSSAINAIIFYSLVYRNKNSKNSIGEVDNKVDDTGKKSII